MQTEQTALDGVVLLTPRRLGDTRPILSDNDAKTPLFDAFVNLFVWERASVV